MPECPTPWGVPIAVGECPHCGGAVGVSLRARPPMALPAGPGQPAAAPPSCCGCPHCGGMLYPALSAVGPIALAPRGDATALVPKDAAGAAATLDRRRVAVTERMPKPPA